ncbi:MAG: LacI family DNA-binding transcriptional regulator [Ktedonobacteraceae bacterium]
MNQTSSKRSTIAELAAQAGVSIPTVSRVLNGRPDVAPATRARIEQIIKESGYIRSSAAKGLRKGSSGIIDLVVPGLENPYVTEIVRGVEDALERTGLRLALSFTQDQALGERQWLEKIADRATEGAILVLAHGQSSRLDELRQRGIPFVVVDHRGELGPDVPSVGATNWAGGRVAVEYLLSLGHRRIAMIAGPASLRCSLDRIAGYRAALEAAGIPIDPELIRPGDFRLQSGYIQTSALLALPDPPTAIFAGNDLQAMGAYKALYLCNIHVPERMSVIGFDDIPLTTIVSPSLTSVRQPLFDMGRVATSMLLRLIAGERLDSCRVELPTTLITRESCAFPPSP